MTALKDKSVVDKIIFENQPYQLLNNNHEQLWPRIMAKRLFHIAV